MDFFDRAALVDRFARVVPWKLAESLLREQASDEVRELNLDEEDMAAACRSISCLWLSSLVATRELVDDPAQIVLSRDMLPDPANNVDDLWWAVQERIELMMDQTLSVDRVRTLYFAFVTALRTDLADKVERIQISDTTVFAIDHGRFTLERVEHAMT